MLLVNWMDVFGKLSAAACTINMKCDNFHVSSSVPRNIHKTSSSCACICIAKRQCKRVQGGQSRSVVLLYVSLFFCVSPNKLNGSSQCGGRSAAISFLKH